MQLQALWQFSVEFRYTKLDNKLVPYWTSLKDIFIWKFQHFFFLFNSASNFYFMFALNVLTDIRRLYSSSLCLLEAMKSPPFWIQPVWRPVSSSRSLLITFLVWAKSSTSTSLGRSCHSRPNEHRHGVRGTKTHVCSECEWTDKTTSAKQGYVNSQRLT